MFKKLLAASALAVGATALVATPASADTRIDYDYRLVSEVTDRYVSASDPAAYGSRGADPIIVSPYGTSQTIWCFDYRGMMRCWQSDPSGVEHDLQLMQIPTGSSAGASRTIAFFNPF